VHRLADDRYVVSDGLCTHGRAHLAEGIVVGCSIECPKHNGRFSLETGAAERRPAREPLTLHPTEIVDGRVIADLAGPEEER
jgi:3-phenylpropionate/trans-cinnamate dioxygenase ferredoxin subunit